MCGFSKSDLVVLWRSNTLNFFRTSYKQNEVEATKQKEEKREKKPKPEEHEGMPQRQHCRPSIKPRGDMNLECHEEQQKDVA
jgi:hypothetical protein